MPVRPCLKKLGGRSSSVGLRGYLRQRRLLIFKIANENRLIWYLFDFGILTPRSISLNLKPLRHYFIIKWSLILWDFPRSIMLIHIKILLSSISRLACLINWIANQALMLNKSIHTFYGSFNYYANHLILSARLDKFRIRKY